MKKISKKRKVAKLVEVKRRGRPKGSKNKPKVAELVAKPKSSSKAMKRPKKLGRPRKNRDIAPMKEIKRRGRPKKEVAPVAVQEVAPEVKRRGRPKGSKNKLNNGRREVETLVLKGERKRGRPARAILIANGKNNFVRLYNFLNSHTSLKPTLDNWHESYLRFTCPSDYKSSIFLYVEGHDLKKRLYTMLQRVSEEVLIEGFLDEEKYPMEKLPEVFRNLKKSLKVA